MTQSHLDAKTPVYINLTVKLEVHTDFLHHEFTEFQVHIPWVSPFHGQLLIKRIFWDYGEPLLFLGLKVTNPPEVFDCVVHSDTSEWNTLEQISANYTFHLDRYFNNLHAYEEMIEYMGTHVDTESDGITLSHCIPKTTNNIQYNFCGNHQTTGSFLLTRLFGTHKLTPLDYLENLLVNMDLVICT